MKNEELAQIFAGQTAALSAICRLLVRKKVVTAKELGDSLHETLTKGLADTTKSRGAAPIMHLLDIIESDDFY